jgi:hypothetical protein
MAGDGPFQIRATHRKTPPEFTPTHDLRWPPRRLPPSLVPGEARHGASNKPASRHPSTGPQGWTAKRPQNKPKYFVRGSIAIYHDLPHSYARNGVFESTPLVKGSTWTVLVTVFPAFIADSELAPLANGMELVGAFILSQVVRRGRGARGDDLIPMQPRVIPMHAAMADRICGDVGRLGFVFAYRPRLFFKLCNWRFFERR